MGKIKKIVGYSKKLNAFVIVVVTLIISIVSFAQDIKDWTCTWDCIIDEWARYIEEWIQRVESGVLLYEEWVEIFSWNILK